MQLSHVKYKLVEGFIHNWLVVGPQKNVVSSESIDPFETEQKIKLLEKFYNKEPELDSTPVEPGPIGDGKFNTETFQDTWSYTKCKGDHWVIAHAFSSELSHLKSWAYVELKANRAGKIFLEVFSFSAIDLWMNGQHLVRYTDFLKGSIDSHTVAVTTNKGINSLLVRCEDIGIGVSPLVFALRICNEDRSPSTAIRVLIPTTIPHPWRRNELEKAFEEAYLDRDIFASHAPVEVKWPKNIRNKATYSVQLQTPSGRIYAQSEEKGVKDEKAFLGHSVSLNEGPYDILFIPVSREYYEEDIRITRKLPVWVAGNHPYSNRIYGSFVDRKKEALLDASRRPDRLFAEIANMALGKWKSVDLQIIQQAVGEIKTQPQFRLKEFLGLVGAFHRHTKNENAITRYLQEAMQDGLLEIDLSSPMGEPSESQQIISLSIQLLLSQMKSDEQKQIQTEQQIQSWLTSHGQLGFKTGDSPKTVAEVLFALSYLVDLAESEQIFDLAGVFMDKMILLLAINTFQGVYGGGYGLASEMDVKGGITQPTAGICRLFWGMGIFNQYPEYYVSLACMENYEMPAILADLASAQEDFWGTEKQASLLKTTYRTVDFMLNAACDIQVGERGKNEHLWQATLGSEAVVFSNHPAANSTISPVLPRFWCGNSRLPKLDHWKDVLIAIYDAPPEDWMGFTHAYFPIYAFDEYKVKENWFFARKDSAYLAITASNPLILLKTGESAYRELRCPGRQAVWICQLGRASWDGSFSVFQKKVHELPVKFEGLTVNFTSLRGDNLNTGWENSFLLNEVDVKYHQGHHILYPFASGAYPMKSLEVQYNEYLLKLNFDPEI
jgi:hypothetical protein